MQINLNEINRLIVIGNEFDLQCGLKSQYKDFFNDIFKIEDIKKKQSLDQMKQNLIERIIGDATANNLETLFCSYINNEINEVEYGEDWLPVSGRFWKKTLSTWDLVFLALFICSKEEEASLLWCDVETVIYIVITWWLIEKPNVKSKWKNNLLSGYSVNSEKYFEDDFEEYLVRWDWIAQEIDSRYIKILENIIETAFKGKVANGISCLLNISF